MRRKKNWRTHLLKIRTKEILIINDVVEATINLVVKAIVTITTLMQTLRSTNHIQGILAEAVVNNGVNNHHVAEDLIMHRALMCLRLARN